MKISNNKSGAYRVNSPSVECELMVGISRSYHPETGALIKMEILAHGEDGRTYRIEVDPKEADQIAHAFGYLKGTRYDVAIPRSGAKPPAAFEVLAFDENHAKELARVRYAETCRGEKPDAIHLKPSERA